MLKSLIKNYDINNLQSQMFFKKILQIVLTTCLFTVPNVIHFIGVKGLESQQSRQIQKF